MLRVAYTSPRNERGAVVRPASAVVELDRALTRAFGVGVSYVVVPRLSTWLAAMLASANGADASDDVRASVAVHVESYLRSLNSMPGSLRSSSRSPRITCSRRRRRQALQRRRRSMTFSASPTVRLTISVATL